MPGSNQQTHTIDTIKKLLGELPVQKETEGVSKAQKKLVWRLGNLAFSLYETCAALQQSFGNKMPKRRTPKLVSRSIAKAAKAAKAAKPKRDRLQAYKRKGYASFQEMRAYNAKHVQPVILDVLRKSGRAMGGREVVKALNARGFNWKKHRTEPSPQGVIQIVRHVPGVVRDKTLGLWTYVPKGKKE